MDITFEEAVFLSGRFGVPLHPDFIFYWSQISKEEFFGLIEWLKFARFNKKLIFPYNKSER